MGAWVHGCMGAWVLGARGPCRGSGRSAAWGRRRAAPATARMRSVGCSVFVLQSAAECCRVLQGAAECCTRVLQCRKAGQGVACTGVGSKAWGRCGVRRLGPLLVGLAPGVDDAQLQLERERRIPLPRLALGRPERLQPPVLPGHAAAEARLHGHRGLQLARGLLHSARVDGRTARRHLRRWRWLRASPRRCGRHRRRWRGQVP